MFIRGSSHRLLQVELQHFIVVLVLETGVVRNTRGCTCIDRLSIFSMGHIPVRSMKESLTGLFIFMVL